MAVKREKTGFTLVELLTVLAIVAMLTGLLIPSLTFIRNAARKAKQKAQLTTIDMALIAFRTDYGDYPPSYWMLPPSSPGAPGPMDYCGAQKLAEALLGWDLLGFHQDSHWQANGTNNKPYMTGGVTHLPGTYFFYDTASPLDMDKRKGPYLELATTNAFMLGDLYGPALAASALSAYPNRFVICDSFGVKKVTLAPGETVMAGTPILYYRANTASKTITPPAAFYQRIYDVSDNVPLTTQLNSIVDGTAHPLGQLIGGDYPVFYNDRYDYGVGIGYGVRDPKVKARPWPHRPDSYILISAGVDGRYGTADDICNFGN